MIKGSFRYMLLLIFSFFSFLHAQNVNMEFDHITSSEGLSQNNPLFTFQDRRGFIWIGTEDGLNLYNGVNIKIYRNNPEDSGSILSNYVRAMVEDDEDNLWIGTQDGLVLYIREEDRFTNFLNNPDDPNTVVSNDIQCLYMDSQKKLWIGTGSGVNIYDFKTREMKLLAHDPANSSSIANNTIKKICEDKDGVIWIASFGGLSSYNPRTDKITNYLHDPEDETTISSAKIQSVFADSKGRIWAGTFDNGLNLLVDQKTGYFKRYYAQTGRNSIPNVLVNSVAEDHEGVIWIGTSGGLCYYNPDDDNFITIQKQAENEKSLTSIDITHVYFDNTGRMWISARFGGINTYDAGQKKFMTYKNVVTDLTSLPAGNVSSFAEDGSGNVWIAVDGGGLTFFDRQKNTFKTIDEGPNGTTNKKVLALCLDSYGLLWIGMWDGGVNVYNTATGKFRYYRNDPSDNTSLCGNNVFYIIEDHLGDIWIATWGSDGICRYNREKDNFKQYRNDPDDPNSLTSSANVMIMEDHEGNLWIPTEGAGLNKFDRKTEKFKHYSTADDGSAQIKGLSNKAVYCIYEDSKNRLWIGTNGGGLNLMNREDETFRYFRAGTDGLPNDAINGILEDRSGNLWISTNNGICQFNPDSLTFKNFSAQDGLQDNQFSRWAFKKMRSGELFFGGVKGFNIIQPENVKENPFVPPVYITGFRLFNQDVIIGDDSPLKENIVVSEEIVLNHKQNVFSFEFVALNYRHPEKNKYKYKMEGFNEDWIALGTKHEASFTNLNRGKYTFRVIASNDDEVWNTEGASIRITVLPPWYKTWLFRIVIFILILSVVMYVIMLRNKQQKEIKLFLENKIRDGEKELKAKIEEVNHKQKVLEDKELAEKEINWFNEGMFIMSQIISKNNNDIDKLGQGIISELVKYIDVNLGAFYIVNGENNDIGFELTGSYGMSSEKVKQRFEKGEGYIGACYNEKKMIVIDNLPENYATLESGLGKVSLRFMLLIPLIHDNKINGIIELTSLKEVPAYKISFLEKLADNLASSIEICNVNKKMSVLLSQLNSHTEELNAQKEEMQQNMEEMQATQEELQRQLEENKRIQELLTKKKHKE